MAYLTISETGKEYISYSCHKKIMQEYKVGDEDLEVIDWYSEDIISLPTGTIEFMVGHQIDCHHALYINFNR